MSLSQDQAIVAVATLAYLKGLQLTLREGQPKDSNEALMYLWRVTKVKTDLTSVIMSCMDLQQHQEGATMSAFDMYMTYAGKVEEPIAILEQMIAQDFDHATTRELMIRVEEKAKEFYKKIQKGKGS